MPGVGKAVTRVELYDAVYRKVGLSRSESSALVELVLKEISDSVAKGETVNAGKVCAWVEIQKQASTHRSPRAVW
jgi:integration host factor subunit alpha